MQVPLRQATVVSLPLPTTLTILFVALKLTGQIDWSWFWVLSPLWIGFAAFAGMLTIFAISVIILGAFIKVLNDQ